MTAATMTVAMQEITKLFADVWAGKPCHYPNTPFKIESVASTATWARFRLRHNDMMQNTLAGLDGNSRFGRIGNVIIELFTPLGAGVKDAYALAESVVNAYEGKHTPSGVWFRNVRIIEGDEIEAMNWYQITVVADFDYEQFN